MTATCYITFGQKYRNETHPVDDRAHPDGEQRHIAAEPVTCEQVASGGIGRVGPRVRAELEPPVPHLVGAVPNFDAEVLAALLRDNYLTPTWHYHLVDVEALAVGWLCAWDRADGEPGIRPPWRSDDLSTALGVPPPAKDTRHTALGDAAWALAIYDHITGGEEKP